MFSDTEALIQFIRHQRLILDYAYVSAAALLIYDYILTLPMEITFVWYSRWSYTKTLYLLTRYIPFPVTGLLLFSQLSLHASVKVCAVTWPVVTWFYIFEVILSECILAIRTWAIWRTDRRIGIGLAFLMMGSLVPHCIFANQFVKSMTFGLPPYTGYRGCFITDVNRFLWVNYFILTIVDIVVLILMVISGIRAFRTSPNRNNISFIIHKDGILFYIYLLGFTVANVVVMLVPPLEFMSLLSPLETVLYSVLTCRIILNIRKVSGSQLDGEDETIELHTVCSETQSISYALPVLSRTAWTASACLQEDA